MKLSAVIRKSWIVILLVIFLWLIYVILHSFEPQHPEPQYQGKKLTEWAREIDQSDFFRMSAYQEHPKQDEQAIAAIRRIGTNALPVALDLLAAKDSWFKRKFEEWTRKYNFPAEEKHFEGVNIIWALGSMAKPAIPVLIQLLQSSDRKIAENMMYALPGAGTNAIPPLIELLNSPDKAVRLRAATTLGDFFRPQMPANKSNDLLIVTGSENFRPQARAAVPVLLSNLDSQNINLVWRIRVIHALGLIREDTPVVVPILVRHIQSETNGMDEIIRGNYFEALGNFGTNAMSAVPLLVGILESNSDQPNSRNKEQVLASLMKIDPKIAKPFLEKWKASLTNDFSTNTIRLIQTPTPSVKQLQHSKTNSP